MTAWTTKDIPSQAGKRVVITGATGGLGFETALALAGAGAEVVLTGRNSSKGVEALERIRRELPGARIGFEMLDLASLASISSFAETFLVRYDRLDTLINNAGAMALPQRKTTADGFELQFGTNYLGHFALTGLLLPRLAVAPEPRVVSLASIIAARGHIHFDDLQSTRGYRPYKAYAQSKLAMLIFALQLQRQSERAGWGIHSMAAHPGISSTSLIDNGPGSGGIVGAASTAVVSMLGHAPAAGALPQIYAATSADAKAGGYYGPMGMMELRGAPGTAHVPRVAQDERVATRLWTISEQLTGVRFPALATAA